MNQNAQVVWTCQHTNMYSVYWSNISCGVVWSGQERHDRGGSEGWQDNKQGSMEEYDHQLYLRPQMTGQAREEEEVWIGQGGETQEQTGIATSQNREDRPQLSDRKWRTLLQNCQCSVLLRTDNGSQNCRRRDLQQKCRQNLISDVWIF